MDVTGMLHGAKLLQFAGFPTSEVLGPDASEEDIRDVDRPPWLGLHQAGLQGRGREEG